MMDADASDEAAIDALVARLFAAFDNRSGVRPDLSGLIPLFADGAIIVKAVGGGSEVMTLNDFIAPRQRLLSDGSLVEFFELETGQRTQRFGNVAQRWSHYAKSGIRGGRPFAAHGQKSIQLVRIDGAWKISALAWDDFPEEQDA
jgi:hypothetical protein